MIKWRKYNLDNWQRLKYEGRELLGKEILLTEKRDGSNISIWLDKNGNTRVSSHNLKEAETKLSNKVRGTKEFPKIEEYLKNELNFNHHYIAYGELMAKGKSPTRIEPSRKRDRWILFDIWDVDNNRFLDYTLIYQCAFHFKIPIVRVLKTISSTTMKELKQELEEILIWCKKHKREGVVGKVYKEKEQIFFKAKIDLPKIKRIKRHQRPKLPQMPEEKIIRAMQHAWDEMGEDETKWKDKRIAMPIIARHVSTEAREHFYSTPKNIFNYYLNTPLKAIKRI